MKETRFKDTEIGRIPVDWEIATLGSISKIKTGPFGSALHSSDYVIQGTPIITVEHIGKFFIDISNGVPQVSDLDRERLEAYMLMSGDIVFSRVGSVDRCSYVSENENGWLFSGRLLRVRPFPKFNSKYLTYCLSSEPSRALARSVAVGLAMPSINTKILSGIKVIVPSSKLEQSRIASALTSIDNLIASLDKLIEKKKNIKQGTIQQLLTGKKRLKGFTELWVEKRIIDSFTFLGNNTYSREELSDTGLVKNVHYGDILIKYGATIDANRNELPFVTGKETASHPLKDGDIIMADTAEDETCGKVCEIRGIGDSLIEAGLHTIALRPNDEYGRWFLGYYMNSSAFHDLLIPLMQGTKVTSISKSALLNVRMVIPSVKAEQTAIANVLSPMDNDISALESKKAKYESIKQGIMQQLLSGKIRLIQK